MHLLLSIKKQVLTLYHSTGITEYPVSTALNGAGEQQGSGCTPRGLHVIRAKVGEHLPLNAVFVGRRFTGEVYSAELARQFPERDWILTRILWLSGKQPGCNRLGAVDSMRRYIYIHGTPDSEPMGIPVSHGCIRMRNADVMALYDLVPVGTELFIEE
ncbi:L,D-transpeptidase [Neptunomonas qingdaonensis]|uniref:L,D-transpeptidase catalytic domain n=1 Tax=Neptunomonas qingdaonensis TaxID=1045558 RepID=A0A1I2RQ03_9GAMM|nr:L,D-transpeptidase [Neptunomonas qingdaonensis]SFG42163.1 L,D-transpeptidase catalytic domain [Neptunomonas qingdaonensis]